MTKDAYYFRHDANARHDHAIKEVIRKYGMDGYGKYWVIIENLREASGYKLQYKSSVLNSLADDMRCKTKDVEEFIKYLVSDDIGLLIDTDKNGGQNYFYSMSLMRRMNHLDSIREKRSKAGSWIRD